MLKDRSKAYKFIRAIDWAALYKDFKARNKSYRVYHREYLAAFLIKAGIVDYIPSYNTFYTHLAAVRKVAQLVAEENESRDDPASDGANASAVESGPQKKFASEKRTAAPDDNQIAVFDLDQIIEDTKIAPASTANNTATDFYKSSLKPDSGTRQLSIEYSGIRFSYPCLDPGRSLASLLFHIRELEEVHHAY